MSCNYWGMALVLVCVSASCSTLPKPVDEDSEAFKSAHLPSYANSIRQEVDNRDVSLRGYLVYEGGQYGLWDSESVYEGGKLDACVTPIAAGDPSRVLRKLSGRLVVLKGTYLSNYMSKDILVSGGCNFSGLRVTAAFAAN